jgi:hypothetical protein
MAEPKILHVKDVSACGMIATRDELLERRALHLIRRQIIITTVTLIIMLQHPVALYILTFVFSPPAISVQLR